MLLRPTDLLPQASEEPAQSPAQSRVERGSAVPLQVKLGQHAVALHSWLCADLQQGRWQHRRTDLICGCCHARSRQHAVTRRRCCGDGLRGCRRHSRRHCDTRCRCLTPSAAVRCLQLAHRHLALACCSPAALAGTSRPDVDDACQCAFLPAACKCIFPVQYDENHCQCTMQRQNSAGSMAGHRTGSWVRSAQRLPELC